MRELFKANPVAQRLDYQPLYEKKAGTPHSGRGKQTRL